MSTDPTEDDARWSPDYDVPENASPFKPLPLLVRCADCGEPLVPLTEFTQVRDGRPVSPLCQTCVTPEVSEPS